MKKVMGFVVDFFKKFPMGKQTPTMQNLHNQSASIKIAKFISVQSDVQNRKEFYKRCMFNIAYLANMKLDENYNPTPLPETDESIIWYRGICWSMCDVAISLSDDMSVPNGMNPFTICSDDIEDYPEVYSQRPVTNTECDGAYWFALNKEGTIERIKILKNAIAMCDEILNKKEAA